MRRKRLLISLGMVFAFVLLVLLGLVVMVKREPSFYEQATIPDSFERRQESQKALTQFYTLLNFDQSWDPTFTSDQLNSYFQQDYYDHGGDENLPEGCHAPRVKIEDGKLRLGVRYGEGLFSTVLSLELKLWLVPNQLNLLAMEIVSLQAGSLPISTGTLIDRISEAARRERIDITWYRREGHPVAIMKFQSDMTRPTFQFERVELTEGKISISGKSTNLGAPQPRVVKK